MKDMLTNIVGVLTGVGVLLVITMIAPLIALASINTLAEQASVDFYIPHNFWTYLSVYGLVIVINGGGILTRDEFKDSKQ